jgi:hypothetical protein
MADPNGLEFKGVRADEIKIRQSIEKRSEFFFHMGYRNGLFPLALPTKSGVRHDASVAALRGNFAIARSSRRPPSFVSRPYSVY